MLARYISKMEKTTDYNSAIMKEQPYYKDGQLHIISSHFRFWLKTEGEQYNKKELARLMKTAGMEHKKDNFYPEGGTPTSRSVYVIDTRKL